MSDLIAYASSFCSYLLENEKNIRAVILFGSASRGSADKESDVDIFIDTTSKKNHDKIKKIIDNFYNTQIYKSWNLRGIKNSISAIAGDIESNEWKDLKRSIITDGIILFGKYKSTPEKLKQCTLFSYIDIKDAKKRVNLYRKLFGYKLGKKYYEGIVIKSNGLRHGRGSFSVPIEHYKEIREVFREMKVTPKITEIWLDS
ncbi:MAG TPA: nucleotidyltransferase domain-containing protein [archaeon]|nr:nucleotidyltransferase domain-containing protein [archaeon]